MPLMRSPREPIFVVLMLVCAAVVQAAGPADELFKLVPREAGATLAIEDLRRHAQEVLASPLTEGFRRLPPVRAWLDSERHRQFAQAKHDIETALHAKVGEIRDGLLGDAVVLVLQPSAGGDPGQARGLLLTRVSDPGLLARLIELGNESERKAGALREVVPISRGNDRYYARRFKTGTKPDEWYATLAGGIFAWSNSESLIQGALDRNQGRQAGLDSDAHFKAVRSALPESALASLYLHPRFLEQLIPSESQASSDRADRGTRALRHYLKALNFAGLALEWRDGLVLHSHEAVDASKLPEALGRWAARATVDVEPARPMLARLAAFAKLDLEPTDLWDWLISLPNQGSPPRMENLLTAAKGVLLGRDLEKEVLPQLGPGIWLGLRLPETKGTPPAVVIATPIRDATSGGSTASALDNGLRTLLAAMALDEKRATPQARVETLDLRGIAVTALSVQTPFAYAVAQGRLVLANNSEAVADSLAPIEAGRHESEIERVRREHVPTVKSFAVIDLLALHRWADQRRPALAEKLASGRASGGDSSRQDLDSVLAFVSLFRAGYLTSTIDPQFRSVHRRLGLIARETALK
jgi:hypothetical protein